MSSQSVERNQNSLVLHAGTNDATIRRKPKLLALHAGTNDAVRPQSREILNILLQLKTRINEKLTEAEITISISTLRPENGKAALTARLLTNHLISLKNDILDKRNVTGKYLNCRECHLNQSGINLLTKILIFKLRKLFWSSEYLNNLYSSSHFSKSVPLFVEKRKNISESRETNSKKDFCCKNIENFKKSNLYSGYFFANSKRFIWCRKCGF